MIDPRLAGYLQRALAHELAAVQQYLTQSALLRLWGMAAQAERFAADAAEELGHAQALIERLLQLGMAPQGATLPAVRPGRNLAEMLAINCEMERDVIRLYDDAARYCHRLRDATSCALLKRLLADEQQHLQHIEQALSEPALAGAGA